MNQCKFTGDKNAAKKKVTSITNKLGTIWPLSMYSIPHFMLLTNLILTLNWPD
ncbi:hypothetical protein AAULR_17981, partial [Lacticaseibacillus rhamnosus MTCC 5462]